jgi:hypothetical protein
MTPSGFYQQAEWANRYFREAEDSGDERDSWSSGLENKVEEDRDGDVEQTTNHRGCVPMGLREKREKMPRLKTTT